MFEFKITNQEKRISNPKHWQFCVGSGQAKLALRADYRDQLKFIHDELGIERVRFHGIFDDSMQTVMGVSDFMPLPFSGGFTDVAFNQIGHAYDNVIAADMKPWVELSFMPSRLAKSKKKVTVNANGMAVPPKSDKEWQKYIKSFINYLITRYGKEEVESWYFEVWNEPNMSSFFKGSQKDYFHLYEITVKAIKEVDEKIKVGGPATAEGKWIKKFIEFCDKKNIPFDFISTHNYPGDGIGDIFLGKLIFETVVGGMKKMSKVKKGSTLEGFRMLMTDKTEVTEYPKGQMYDFAKRVNEEVSGRCPIFVTEWNVNALLTSESNESRKPACFQVKTCSEMDGFVTGSSIWCFSDHMDEFMLLPDDFCGGWGFITQSGIPRPQFWAMKLMSQTGGKKLVLPRTNAEVELDVYESENEKQVFVYRQRMKNVDEPREAYCVELCSENAPLAVELYRIDDEHCNPYRVYQSMGSPKDLTPAQVNEIKERSRLVCEKCEYTYENGVLKISSDIGVNDVHCYKIKQA